MAIQAQHNGNNAQNVILSIATVGALFITYQIGIAAVKKHPNLKPDFDNHFPIPLQETLQGALDALRRLDFDSLKKLSFDSLKKNLNFDSLKESLSFDSLEQLITKFSSGRSSVSQSSATESSESQSSAIESANVGSKKVHSKRNRKKTTALLEGRVVAGAAGKSSPSTKTTSLSGAEGAEINSTSTASTKTLSKQTISSKHTLKQTSKQSAADQGKGANNADQERLEPSRQRLEPGQLGPGGDSSAYKMVPVQGKGLGMIATRKIKRGELLVEEIPIMSVNDKQAVIKQTKQSNYESSAILDVQFQNLSNDNQKIVMDLYAAPIPGAPIIPNDSEPVPETVPKNSEGVTRTTAGAPKTVANIFRTNCVERGADGTGSLLCVRISRFNHSCRPNVLHAWSEPYERLYAARDVEEGEELCTSYVLPTEASKRRRLMLKFGYAIDCQCSYCTLAAEEIQKSDKRLEEYRNLDDKVPKVGILDPDAAIENVQECLSILKKENLYLPGLVKRHAYDAFQLAMSCGKTQAARKWIKLSYEESSIEQGENHPITKRAKRYSLDCKDWLRDRGVDC